MKNIDSQGLVADLCVGMLISLSPGTLSWMKGPVPLRGFKKAITGSLSPEKQNPVSGSEEYFTNGGGRRPCPGVLGASSQAGSRGDRPGGGGMCEAATLLL